jgi:hypothetical protein
MDEKKTKFKAFSDLMNEKFPGWCATFNLKPTKKLLKSITGLKTTKKIKHMFLVIFEE